jgi:hypothetical protein
VSSRLGFLIARDLFGKLRLHFPDHVRPAEHGAWCALRENSSEQLSFGHPGQGRRVRRRHQAQLEHHREAVAKISSCIVAAVEELAAATREIARNAAGGARHQQVSTNITAARTLINNLVSLQRAA